MDNGQNAKTLKTPEKRPTFFTAGVGLAPEGENPLAANYNLDSSEFTAIPNHHDQAHSQVQEYPQGELSSSTSFNSSNLGNAALDAVQSGSQAQVNTSPNTLGMPLPESAPQPPINANYDPDNPQPVDINPQLGKITELNQPGTQDKPAQNGGSVFERTQNGKVRVNFKAFEALEAKLAADDDAEGFYNEIQAGREEYLKEMP